MKQRIISACFIVVITVTLIVLGGWPFNIFAAFIILWGSYEFCKNRDRKINWLEYLLMVAFCLLINFFFSKALGIVLAFVVCLIGVSVFDEDLSLSEISVTFVESMILGFSVHYMIEIETLSKLMFAYIVIIAYVTDCFALLSGMKFGKHKLNVRISPKKTIEGAMGGWLIGGLLSFVFAAICKFFYMDALFILACSFILPVISQIGDLAFSLIKRHYFVKDFSKLIPGHGGLLDRLDSLLFVLITYGALAILFGIY